MRQVSQRLPILLLFAAASLFVAGSSAQAANTSKREQGKTVSQPAAVVKITDNKFEPATVTIKAGQTVEWQNNGVTGHTVTDDASKAKVKTDAFLPEGAKPFNSGSLKHGASFHHTFTVPGTYKYFCMGHEGMGMLGTVVVEPASGGAGGHRSTGGSSGYGNSGY